MTVQASQAAEAQDSGCGGRGKTEWQKVLLKIFSPVSILERKPSSPPSDLSSQPKCSSTYFSNITEGGTVVYAKGPGGVDDMTPALFASSVQCLPPSSVYPKLPPQGQPQDSGLDIELTRAPDEYIKRPNILYIHEGVGASEALETQPEEGVTCSFPDYKKIFLQEAKYMELVSQTPHPNIVRYMGVKTCKDESTGNEYVYGIVMERHKENLAQYLQGGNTLVDKTSFMDSLRSAVDHVHSCGLVHNDINPQNIMVSKQGAPVLIDFSACKQEGQILDEAGIEGWYDSNHAFVARKERDLWALDKLERWLDGPDYQLG